MTALPMMITNAGLDAIVDAQNGGTDTVEIVRVEVTAQPFVMAPTLTAIPGQFKSLATVSGMAASETIIHLTAYDTSTEVYDVTGFGLFDANDVLIAVYSAAENPILSKAGPAFAMLAVDIAFAQDVAAQISFGNAIFTYPPATKTTLGVVRLADDVTADAGIDDEEVMTAKMVTRLIRKIFGEHLITIYTGPANAIPAGWLLCDGANGTPDLRDKIIVGAGPQFPLGTTGGSLEHDHGAATAAHSLTTAQIPEHRHLNVVPGASAAALGAGNSISEIRVAGGDSEYVLNAGAGEPTIGRSSAVGAGEGHDHEITSANHMPPYYVVAFIKKVW